MIKIYTEQTKNKLVQYPYDTLKIKTRCTLPKCNKSLGDTFEKREHNFLLRGNFCSECAGESQRKALTFLNW